MIDTVSIMSIREVFSSSTARTLVLRLMGSAMIARAVHSEKIVISVVFTIGNNDYIPSRCGCRGRGGSWQSEEIRNHHCRNGLLLGLLLLLLLLLILLLTLLVLLRQYRGGYECGGGGRC